MCLTLFYSLFKFKKKITNPQSHRLYYAKIIDPFENSLIDEALVVYMKAPNTYTREDVLEIQCHSSYATLSAIMDVLIKCGVRPAKPGEFTYRAFINGRIDLTQAESLMDLINSQTFYENKIALNILEGSLFHRINEIRDKVLSVLSTLEANIDFPDDVEESDYGYFTDSLINEVLNPLNKLVSDYKSQRVLREGAIVAIVGRPNVGKSSIFNALLGMGRVIVSPIPGTTRDVVRETIELNGIRVTLMDTAGIREDSNDPIEQIGVEITKDEIKKADLMIFVMDITNPLTIEDLGILRIISEINDVKILFVLNKSDLVDLSGYNFIPIKSEITNILQSESSKIIPISAKTNYGLDLLKKEISNSLISWDFNWGNIDVIVNLRQKRLIENAIESCKNAITSIKEGKYPELICIDLRDVISNLDEITGRELGDDVLEEIFSNFCIGK